jgi:hypothetical protein
MLRSNLTGPQIDGWPGYRVYRGEINKAAEVA